MRCQELAARIISDLGGDNPAAGDGDIISAVGKLIAELAIQIEPLVPDTERGRFEAYILPVLINRAHPGADGRWCEDLNPSLQDTARGCDDFDPTMQEDDFPDDYEDAYADDGGAA